MKKEQKLLKKILVVEDEKALAQAIKMKLEISGFDVLSANCVSQACDLVENNNIDFIWLDHYLLGEEDGFDFVVKMKENKSSTKNIPIFVVSNTASNDKIKSYINFGVDKYYVKANYRLDQIIEDLKLILKS